MATSPVYRPALLAHAAGTLARRTMALAHQRPSVRAFDRGRAEARPLCRPASLTSGRADEAEAIYRGRFTLAGRTVETGSRSIFEVPSPSPRFAAERDGFAWLAHHAAAGDPLAFANARTHVLDFLNRKRRGWPDPAHRPAVAGRRVMAWLAHADDLLNGASSAFARRFMAGLSGDVSRLSRSAALASDGVDRLTARIALANAALALPMPAARREDAWRHLSGELDRQILADGGHVSRSPTALTSLLADCLALRETAHAQGCPVPYSLNRAVDSMAPALAFFRHADGSLARFNGGGAGDRLVLGALERRCRMPAEPASHAPHSGFRRLAAGGTVLIADAGRPPSLAFAGQAHAGTLAFEFSAGRDRMVVNCGRPGEADVAWRRPSRATAAHSTVTVEDCSSSRFAVPPALEGTFGQPLVPGPRAVRSRARNGEGPGFDADHDGYLARFGVRHRRMVRMAADGLTLEGIDRLEGRAVRAVARFHLDPAVNVAATARGAGLFLRDQDWELASDAPIRVEETVVFDGTGAPRRSQQLVIAFPGEPDASVRWRFRRLR